MLAMDRLHDRDMRNLEKELADSLASRRGSDGEPLAGLLNLTRRMEEEEDQFDVDLTIMDFLAFKAIQLVFEWRASTNPHQSDLPSALVTMTAEWRSFLSQKHGGRRLNNQAAFRSRLLQFVLLFSHRLNHDKTWTTEESLNDIRAQNRKRGTYWQQQTDHAPALELSSSLASSSFDPSNEFPLSDGALAENRQELASALDMPQDRRRWVTDVEGTPSLHCLLPLFIELIAARVALGDWIPSTDWLELTGQFMLQAVIEEYLRNGAYGEETFNTVFAFGCPGTSRWADEGADIQAMRRLFCDENNPREQIHGWSNIKQQYIDELLPQPGSRTSFLQAMEQAQQRHQYAAFEKHLLGFLQDIHDGIAKPDLVQVEEGKITIHGSELADEDSREMIRRMGL